MQDDANDKDDKTVLESAFDALTEDEQMALLGQTSALLFKATIARAMPQMSRKDKEHLDLLLESGADSAALISFLRDRVPDFESIAHEEALKLQDTLRANLSKITDGQ